MYVRAKEATHWAGVRYAKAPAYMIIEVKFEARDGCLHVTSEQVPGLYLCRSNLHEVIDDIIPAIKALFKLNRGWDIEVVPETEASLFPAAREKLDLPIRARLSD